MRSNVIGTTAYPPRAAEYLDDRCGVEQAKRADIRYLTAEEAKKLVGLPKDKIASDGLGVRLSGKYWVVRFLREGAKPKFKQQAGSTNTFYEGPFPPKCKHREWKAIRGSPSVTLHVVEGWIKANALLALGIVAIGLNGTYGWLSDHAPIEDFDRYKWRGRKVILCFDSDILQKTQVRLALAGLAKLLRSLKARVYVKILPTGANESNVGPDDYVREYGADKFLDLKSFKFSHPQFADWDAPLHVQELNQSLGFILHDGRALILRTEPDPEYPGTFKMTLPRVADIRLKYANEFYTCIGHKGVEIQAPKFPAWLEHPRRREVRRLLLDPSKPSGYDCRTKDFNMWQGWSVVPHKPDASHSWSLLQAHIRKVIANGNAKHADYIMKTLAFWVQRPAELPEVAPVLHGGEGTGKGKLWKSVLKLFGRHGIHLSTRRQLTGNFNEHLKDKLLIFADEAVFAADRSVTGTLYAMITEATMSIEPKFVNLYSLPNFRKFPMSTNENWSVPAGIDARRFAVFRVSDAHKQDHKYFAAIDDQLSSGGFEAMLWDLQHMDLADFDPRRFPRTSILFEQKRFSFDETTKWWFACLLDGLLPSDEDKWTGKISTVTMQTAIAKDTTNPYARQSLDTAIGVQLRKLCPAMRKERHMGRPHVGERRRIMHYMFPSLAECRAAFEKAVQQRINWKTGEAIDE